MRDEMFEYLAYSNSVIPVIPTHSNSSKVMRSCACCCCKYRDTVHGTRLRIGSIDGSGLQAALSCLLTPVCSPLMCPAVKLKKRKLSLYWGSAGMPGEYFVSLQFTSNTVTLWRRVTLSIHHFLYIELVTEEIL